MKTIWKFPIRESNYEIKVPRSATVVHVALQDGTPTIWAEIDLAQEFVVRHVSIIGTGQPIFGDGWAHVGTVLDGIWVWHVYLQDDPQ